MRKTKTMKKPYPSLRVFENPYLERLTHVHPIMPLVVWAPIVLFLFYRSVATLGYSVASIVGLAVFGFFIWTLSEYLLHRYVFHFPARTPFQKRILFLIHGLHHDDANDPTRLVMPPAGSIILGILLYSGYRMVFALFGDPNQVVPFFAGFVIGYLCYDYIHYGIHHFRITSRVGKWVKQNHMLHHFSDPESRWGVSTPIWDYVFRTYTSSSTSSSQK